MQFSSHCQRQRLVLVRRVNVLLFSLLIVGTFVSSSPNEEERMGNEMLETKERVRLLQQEQHQQQQPRIGKQQHQNRRLDWGTVPKESQEIYECRQTCGIVSQRCIPGCHRYMKSATYRSTSKESTGATDEATAFHTVLNEEDASADQLMEQGAFEDNLESGGITSAASFLANAGDLTEAFGIKSSELDILLIKHRVKQQFKDKKMEKKERMRKKKRIIARVKQMDANTKTDKLKEDMKDKKDKKYEKEKMNTMGKKDKKDNSRARFRILQYMETVNTQAKTNAKNKNKNSQNKNKYQSNNSNTKKKSAVKHKRSQQKIRLKQICVNGCLIHRSECSDRCYTMNFNPERMTGDDFLDEFTKIECTKQCLLLKQPCLMKCDKMPQNSILHRLMKLNALRKCHQMFNTRIQNCATSCRNSG